MIRSPIGASPESLGVPQDEPSPPSPDQQHIAQLEDLAREAEDQLYAYAEDSYVAGFLRGEAFAYRKRC